MAVVEITPEAERQFDALPLRVQGRVRNVFIRLQSWPAVSGARPLRGRLKGHHRIRTGDYRIRFVVGHGVITVYKIGNRKDVYDD